LNLAEIRDARHRSPGIFPDQRKGRAAEFFRAAREKIKCEFDNAAEINKAIHLLGPLLSSTLKVNVEWNGEKRRFEKKKTILTP